MCHYACVSVCVRVHVRQERELQRESLVFRQSVGELLTSGGRRSHGNILSTEPSGAVREQSEAVGAKKTPESCLGACFQASRCRST